MNTRSQSFRLAWYTSLAFLLVAGATTVRAAENLASRVSQTSQGQGIQRGSIGDGATSLDELGPLVTTGDRNKTTRASDQQNPTASGNQTPDVDFWFYDVDVTLFSDFDRDGYFFGIDLIFDADTHFSVAEVYAVIYLSYEYGAWNEYVVTEDFTLFGTSGGDEYVVETELVSGYLTGHYDILIELFDAYDGTFVASIGPDESPELSFLPLEDAGRDTPPGTQIVVNNGGGGSMSWLALAALLGLVRLTRKKPVLNRVR